MHQYNALIKCTDEILTAAFDFKKGRTGKPKPYMKREEQKNKTL